MEGRGSGIAPEPGPVGLFYELRLAHALAITAASNRDQAELGLRASFTTYSNQADALTAFGVKDGACPYTVRERWFSTCDVSPE